jgi:hypothetical protein
MKIYFIAKLVIAAAVLIMMLIVSFSCNGPKTYEFQYSVDVRYNDGTRETLVGTSAEECEHPEKVTFQINTLFRNKGCLSLGVEGGCIATDVKSFSVNVLKYVEVKNGK